MHSSSEINTGKKWTTNQPIFRRMYTSNANIVSTNYISIGAVSTVLPEAINIISCAVKQGNAYHPALALINTSNNVEVAIPAPGVLASGNKDIIFEYIK
jgi:hypothetical protein